MTLLLYQKIRRNSCSFPIRNCTMLTLICVHSGCLSLSWMLHNSNMIIHLFKNGVSNEPESIKNLGI